jgi:hypothetical protein
MQESSGTNKCISHERHQHGRVEASFDKVRVFRKCASGCTAGMKFQKIPPIPKSQKIPTSVKKIVSKTSK